MVLSIFNFNTMSIISPQNAYLYIRLFTKYYLYKWLYFIFIFSKLRVKMLTMCLSFNVKHIKFNIFKHKNNMELLMCNFSHTLLSTRFCGILFDNVESPIRSQD